jgi:DNA-binding response OmpR family regulator
MPKNEDQIKIALVEDDPFLSSMYSTKFEMEGFKVVLAADGEKGIEMIRQEKPDLVLLDILMPKKNGFDVLREVKADKEIQNIPVILLSNLNQANEVDHGKELGAADFLIKAHYMPSEVVDRIKKVLRDSGSMKVS